MTTRVFIQGNYIAPYIRMFLHDSEFMGVSDIEDADLVVFTGGEDVNPKLYGEAAIPQTQFRDARDDEDQIAYWTARALELPMVGICRGGQFLNVMNGGKMWQHVAGHTTSHFIRDTQTQAILWASSTHHQQMRPGADCDIVAMAKSAEKDLVAPTISTFKQAEHEKWIQTNSGKPDPDYEVLYYSETSCLCFQPHPELNGFNDLRDYFFQLLERYNMTLRKAVA